jgi:hypothetical protein
VIKSRIYPTGAESKFRGGADFEPLVLLSWLLRFVFVVLAPIAVTEDPSMKACAEKIRVA